MIAPAILVVPVVTALALSDVCVLLLGLLLVHGAVANLLGDDLSLFVAEEPDEG